MNARTKYRDIILMKKKNAGVYIDLFSGCGGLSLGLGSAGWRGLLAVEKDPAAFSTLQHNMIDKGSKYAHFDWPEWLPLEATTIQNLLKKYPKELAKLNGEVDLIAGGPPCQGFSLAGMRKSNDPRNKMSQEYVKMVDIVRPTFLLLENVCGFNAAFGNGVTKTKKILYSEVVKKSIEKLGYKVFKDYICCEKFGVPQIRTRFIMIGIRQDVFNDNDELQPFKQLNNLRSEFLKRKGLSSKPISVQEAISDLEINRRGAKLVAHSGPTKNGFKQLDYQVPEKLTPYQSLMRNGLNGQKPNSMRLARHRKSTIAKFKLIRKICRLGCRLNNDERKIVGTRKQSICVLDPQEPSKTITTLPDDLLHYKESRILTVRESARLQSFPDDFEFKGKYTTGGKVRTKECPRYTQVGNAVPPLLAEVLGLWVQGIQR